MGYNYLRAMKKYLLFFLIFLSSPLFAQSINSDGCLECDVLSVGDTFTFQGTSHYVVDRSGLDTAIANNQDLTKYCTSKITDMSSLSLDSLFNQAIGFWDVSNVNNMANIFSGATSFNQDISSWNTASVTNTSSMFQNASAFNQSLTQIGNSWNLESVANMNGMFDGATSLSTNNYDIFLYSQANNTATNSNISITVSSNYTDSTSRAYLTGTKNWTINDNGFDISSICNPDTSVIVSGSLDFCDGGSVTLTAAIGQSYSWNTGDTTQSITVNQAGSYYAVINTINGCVDTTAIYTTTIFTNADTSLTASGPLDFCRYDDVILAGAEGQLYLWSTGETTPSITINQAGLYFAIATTINGCNDTTTIYVTTIFPTADTSVTASGSLDFCSYDDVTLTAASGYSYLWNTGDTTQAITSNTAGSYFAVVTAPNGCKDTTDTYTTAVFDDADTNVTVSGSLDFCSHDNVILTAAAGQSYLWSSGETSQSVNINQAGTYNAIVTTTNGCLDTTAAFTTTIFPDADTGITASGPLDFCSYDYVTLTGAAGQTYLWSNGDTLQASVINTTGDYFVTATTTNGCSANSDTTAVTVFPDVVLPQIISVHYSYVPSYVVSNGLGWVGTGLMNSLTILSDSNHTYQWRVKGGVITSGQGTDSLVITWGIPDTNASVWLIVTRGACKDSTSLNFVISGIGFDENFLLQAKLYPNPNDGCFTIEIPERYIGSEMIVMDGIGRPLERLIIQETKTNIDIRKRPKGVYRVHIKSQQGIKTIPLIKQ